MGDVKTLYEQTQGTRKSTLEKESDGATSGPVDMDFCSRMSHFPLGWIAVVIFLLWKCSSLGKEEKECSSGIFWQSF